MSALTEDEMVSLLLVRWHRIDAPRMFRKGWRVGPYRWLCSAAIYRHWQSLGIRRMQFETFHVWTVTLPWFAVWWYRKAA